MTFFDEIMEMRNKGNLNEAEMKYTGFQPQDETDELRAKQAISWVFYDRVKNVLEERDYKVLSRYARKIKEEDLLQENDEYFTKQYLIQIGFHFITLSKEAREFDKFEIVDRFYGIIKKHIKPLRTKGNSLIFSAALMIDDEWDGFTDFLHWNSFLLLREDDFEPFTADDGRTFMSVGERIYLAYSEMYIDKYQYYREEGRDLSDVRVEMERLAVKIKGAIEREVEQEWLSYALAKLQFTLGQFTRGFKNFVPFALRNTGKFWVWDLIGDFYREMNEKQAAFQSYCKALTTKDPDQFTLNVRTALVPLLLDRGEYAWAKREVDIVFHVRNSHGWSVPESIEQWKSDSWYDNHRAMDRELVEDNYKNPARQAIEKLLPYTDSKIGHIEWIDEKIDRFKARFDEEEADVLNNLDPSYQVGQFLKVYFVTDDNRRDVVFIEEIEDPGGNEWKRSFAGIFKRAGGRSFGFVNTEGFNTSIFVPPPIVEEMPNGCKKVTGVALRSWDDKKSRWSWKAIEIHCE